MPTRILFLAANPKSTDRLRLDEEAREITELIRRAGRQTPFKVQQHWALRPDDLRRAMLDFDPHIVHFSGHGAGPEGIILENDHGGAGAVTASALKALFKLFPNVQCVLLNACYSETQATAMAAHVKYVIGMQHSIGDDAAIAFASGFYDALAAKRPIPFAYEYACTSVLLEGMSAGLSPIFHVNEQRESTTRMTVEPPERQHPRGAPVATDSRAASDATVGTEPQRVLVFWHRAGGLTQADAVAIQQALRVQGVDCIVAEHADPNPPDAVFISFYADPALVCGVLGRLKHSPSAIFPLDYPDAECGALSEFTISAGLQSTWRQGARPAEEEPFPLRPGALNTLCEDGLSRFEFQSRLMRLTSLQEPLEFGAR